MKISTKSQPHRACGFEEIIFLKKFSIFFLYFCILVSMVTNENEQLA